MSWFVVFASTVLPIALLFILLATDWLQRGSSTASSQLRYRRRGGTDNGEGAQRSIMVGEAVTKARKCLVSAGMIAFAMVAGQDLNAQTSGPQITTLMTTDVSGAGTQAWNVRTVALAPGVVDARHSYAGAELVYVLEGAGVLEVEGRTPVALTPGVVATLDGKQSHVFKNTSRTQMLKVLVVLLIENGPQRHMFANGEASSHDDVRKRAANAGLGQEKVHQRNSSTRPGLVF